MDDVEPVPHGRTARRLTWEFLPPKLRGEIQRRLGSRVVSGESRDAGFTPGFASVLTGEDGRQVFVKAASKVAQAYAADSYRDEARKLTALPASVPAPELLWVHEDDLWIAVGMRVVAGRPPTRPWVREELDRALEVAEQIAEATAPVPAMGLEPITAVIGGFDRFWFRAADRPHRDEAAELAAAYVELPMDAFCHTDLRDDNILLTAEPAGDVAVDWNWPTLATPWQDSVDLLVSAWGDGLDADAVLAQRRLTRDVDPEHIDMWLAALCGYMVESSRKKAPSNSPYLRVHGRWYAAALWGWLGERRGWS
ncbi:hypothetical protein D9V37_06695 [Nocardioides mangrovicus]|uniref:Aminoglycoside phosphotransferase domain-containing protein n=2 Tax=Nocardioides mangrovicus TaxID=2478913 RepID=A0A3L8P2H1_9ACTN|nr:hypothetical protein D9V37_06695 [Nocardioides mangrovicus]